LLKGAMLKPGELFATRCQCRPAANQLGTRGMRRVLESLALGEICRNRARPGADHRQCTVNQDADLDEVICPAPLGKREQRRPASHDREAGEERRYWLLLSCEPLPMPSDIGRGEAKLRIGGGDPGFGSFDRLSGGGLLCFELLGLAAAGRGALLKSLGFGVRGRLFRLRSFQRIAERLALRRGRSACAKERH
jgi:hypothetical protein